MGAKKKARSRQKQAVKEALVVESATCMDKENKGYLFQPGDDLERFLVHIHTCKKQNSKRLDKFMPTLFHHLNCGKVSAEELVADFMDVYNSKFHNMGCLERIAIRGKLQLATKG